jgi:hypothetical protein
VTQYELSYTLLLMRTVADIIEALKRLDNEQKREFLLRLAEVDFEELWDRQIETDANAGKLDMLWRQTLHDIKTGNVKPLDDVLNNT